MKSQSPRVQSTQYLGFYLGFYTFLKGYKVIRFEGAWYAWWCVGVVGVLLGFTEKLLFRYSGLFKPEQQWRVVARGVMMNIPTLRINVSISRILIETGLEILKIQSRLSTKS